jgi:type III restriction enzyme
VKLHFDGQQLYQLDAIRSVVDLFGGQPAAAGSFERPITMAEPDLLATLGVANTLSITQARLLENLRSVQERNKLPIADALAEDDILGPRNFSVEMETGTGKTYVYLRTIYELHQAYGWKKFVIVVPSVAIREGVTQSIVTMAEHFAAIYGRVPLEHWVYDSGELSRLRQFAFGSQLQVLIINIQAFDKKKVSIIHQDLDAMRPIEFVQQSQPIVIMDEPQNMESENARSAIQELNPLFTLRYSATHKNINNLVYRLDPVQAYDLGLVKRIEVDSVMDQGDFNRPYLAVESITTAKAGLSAKITFDVKQGSGVKRKTISVKKAGEDLFRLSGERDVYRGYIIDEINADFVSFENNILLRCGESQGSQIDLIMRVQIKETIREHFRKELVLLPRSNGERIKVLSLFFVDHVANYADADGKIRRWFEEEYRKLAASSEFASLNPLPVELVHNGYFARDGEGFRDSKEDRSTKADNEAYELIMRDKARLLSPDEPLRFIFSHSALREGWDNPNVFQICTLRESRSDNRRRQEIGRGLRLARLENGFRCDDPKVNRLTLIANESFAEFARGLQNQLQTECGVSFANRILNKRDRTKLRLQKERFASDEFRDLWALISQKTRYEVAFKTEELVAVAARLFRDEPKIVAPEVLVKKSRVLITVTGVEEETRGVSFGGRAGDQPPLPDIIGYLQRETELTRTTLVNILVASDRVGEALLNPQQFMETAVRAIQHAKRALMVDGIKYERIVGQTYEMRLFQDEEIESYLNRLLPVAHSVYDAVEYDSEVERDFAAALDANEDVRLFVKLPRWFMVKTPLGDYRPDWALVRDRDGRVYLVVETKGTTDIKALPDSERLRVKCGKQHFEQCLNVEYKLARTVDDIV